MPFFFLRSPLVSCCRRRRSCLAITTPPPAAASRGRSPSPRRRHGCLVPPPRRRPRLPRGGWSSLTTPPSVTASQEEGRRAVLHQGRREVRWWSGKQRGRGEGGEVRSPMREEEWSDRARGNRWKLARGGRNAGDPLWYKDRESSS
jgi:hypothetical protein